MKNSNLLALALLGFVSLFTTVSASAATDIPLQYRFNSNMVRHEAIFGDVTDQSFHVVFQNLRYSPEADGTFTADVKDGNPRVILRKQNQSAPTHIDHRQVLLNKKAIDLSEKFTGATNEHQTRNSIDRVISARSYMSWQRKLLQSNVYHRNVSYHENGVFRVRSRQTEAQARALKIRRTYN